MFRYLAHRHGHKHILRSLRRQEQAGDRAIGFAWDTALAFGVRNAADSYDSFVDLTLKELSGGDFFAPILPPVPVSVGANSVVFRSDIATEREANSIFDCVVTDSGSKDHALVVLHHWYARNRYPAFSRYFSSKGITVVEATLPWHFGRGASDAFAPDRMFSANLGLTVSAFRQAVLDGRKVVRWLKAQGYARVSVVGMCLGGTVAGLIAAHEGNVDKAVLMVAAGSPADLVWSAESMPLIRGHIEPALTLPELRKAWGLISLEYHARRFARCDLNTMIVTGTADTIVRPEVSDRLIRYLHEADVSLDVLRLGCGHSSVGMFPYNIRAARNVLRFLQH